MNIANIVEQLQQHLKTPIQSIREYSHKEQAPRLECVDGFTMSLQASKYHYCEPRDDTGPYTHVEVWMCGDVPEWSEYGDGSEPYAYLPINLVALVVGQHGGIKQCSHNS